MLTLLNILLREFLTTAIYTDTTSCFLRYGVLTLPARFMGISVGLLHTIKRCVLGHKTVTTNLARWERVYVGFSSSHILSVNLPKVAIYAL